MSYDLSEGFHTCSSCGKEFYVSEITFPERDIKHAIGCPYCDATVGYASGTHDFHTIKKEDMSRDDAPECPKCGATMTTKINHSSGQSFWGCPNFPRCDGTRSKTNDTW